MYVFSDTRVSSGPGAGEKVRGAVLVQFIQRSLVLGMGVSE